MDDQKRLEKLHAEMKVLQEKMLLKQEEESLRRDAVLKEKQQVVVPSELPPLNQDSVQDQSVDFDWRKFGSYLDESERKIKMFVAVDIALSLVVILMLLVIVLL